jgi:pimeloyl-ACP methyl ester carboxylesterase
MMKRIWTVITRGTALLLGVLLVLGTSGFGCRMYRLHQLAEAVRTPYGIDEASFVRVGGIDQWVTIRGQNRDNPVLLFLHGGPGFAFLSLNPRAFLKWEKDFTLVQWDQRGAGKTYGKSGPLGPAVTIDEMARDGVELAEFVRERLQKQKVILVGLSWGTIVGIHMAKIRPELFTAYVGTGQVAKYLPGRRLAYTQLVAEARARADRKAVGELEGVGPPPYESSAKAGVHAQWATAYEPGMPSMWNNISTVLFDSAITVRDVSNLIKGMGDSEDHFRVQLDSVDLPALGSDFAIPIFVFQGARDNVNPVQSLTGYFDSIKAPQKRLVVIPGAGHNVMLTKSDDFLRLLVELVRPLAVQGEPLPRSAHPR